MISALLLALASAGTAAAAELRPFSARYSITSKGISAGTAEVRLQSAGEGRWAYETSITASFLARTFVRSKLPAELQRSEFFVRDGRVIPDRYTADDRSSSKDQLLAFDWNRGRVSGVFEHKPVDLATQSGMLDNHTVQVALMNDLLANRAPQRFFLVEKGRIRETVFITEGSEKLRTAVGEYQTVKYRSGRPGSDKSMIFWCAPELGYLPLKVERRDGKDLEVLMTVETVTFDTSVR